ncbi:unnamed protein product [Polarella glacialis]|uniref:Uncharacterized protein n=1 Tax=Polarella glacialis TaxID=89957 RepID=A0A813JTL7_POLGL|nr:unnamed protein product [Polarella glacialis]
MPHAHKLSFSKISIGFQSFAHSHTCSIQLPSRMVLPPDPRRCEAGALMYKHRRDPSCNNFCVCCLKSFLRVPMRLLAVRVPATLSVSVPATLSVNVPATSVHQKPLCQ